jgi:hypothetical protein
MLRYLAYACLPLLLLSCTACEPFVPVLYLQDAARRDLQARIPVYDESTLEHGTYQRLGAIEATSCQLGLGDASSSNDDAIDQLRYKAASMGGNGVATVLCEKPRGMSLSKSCWNSVVCHGVAIKHSP